VESQVRNLLEPIVRRAGEHLVASWGTLEAEHVDRKGVIDLVTHVDLESQAILHQGLQHSFPGQPILAEEGSEERRARAGFQWLVDPLDGTTNFVHGLPLFAISVARLRDGTLDCGMVYAPLLGELYWGARGGGRTHAHTNLREWSRLATRSRGLRRCGAAALDLAWVAAGRFDAFWEFRLGPWDLAAGALLVREAGGCLSDPRGGSEFLWSGDLVASNALLHEQLLRELHHASSS
jgi:myo-inositol-1(or 4)-monophosphatase